MNLSDDCKDKKTLIKELNVNRVENQRLKSTLNEAVDKCAALTVAEKELRDELQKKDKQIENIINSRNLMQKTLAEQFQSLKIKNQELSQDLAQVSEKFRYISLENENLKIIVHKTEKAKLSKKK